MAIRDPRTYAVIGAAMAVHTALGPGLAEKVYQLALAIEFRHRKIDAAREVPLPLVYRGEPLGAARIADFLWKGVVVEIKASERIVDAHVAQTLHYMRAGGFGTGLILNFGEASLAFKRIICEPPT